MASVNQTRPHCVNQMGKTHSKILAVRHGRGTAWSRHGHSMLCVNRPEVRLLIVTSPGAQTDSSGVKWLSVYSVWDLGTVKEGSRAVGSGHSYIRTSQIYFQITTNKTQHFLIYLFLQTLCVFQAVLPPIIRSTQLYIQFHILSTVMIELNEVIVNMYIRSPDIIQFLRSFIHIY